MNRQIKKSKTKGSLLYYFQTRAQNLELILLVAIFGIFSIILLGKYFELKAAVTSASEQAFFGNLQSALLLFATEKIIETGRKTFPDPRSPLFDRLLKSENSYWSYKPIDDATGRIEFDIGNEEQSVWYYSISPSFPDSTEFTIVRGIEGLHPFKGEQEK